MIVDQFLIFHLHAEHSEDPLLVTFKLSLLLVCLHVPMILSS